LNLPPARIAIVPRQTISVNGTEYSKFEPAWSGSFLRMPAIHSRCGSLFGTRGRVFGGKVGCSFWCSDSGTMRGLLQ
jgi:hypothetical protein